MKVVVEHLGELEKGAVVQIVPHEESQDLCFDDDDGGWGGLIGFNDNDDEDHGQKVDEEDDEKDEEGDDYRFQASKPEV